jgi:outer membrane protein assembly factor BamE (lipoprotein component of BamABCDE complex)
MTPAPKGRRSQFRIITLLAIIALVAVVIAKWPFVSSDRVEGVKVGMTEAEVTAVMGKPYSRGGRPGEEYYWTWARWPIHVVVVHFSPDGRVTESFND